MVITSIDIQSVEPVDQRTRDSLQKSVQLAIEITTNSQEAAARHEAERLEQEAKGENVYAVFGLFCEIHLKVFSDSKMTFSINLIR